MKQRLAAICAILYSLLVVVGISLIVTDQIYSRECGLFRGLQSSEQLECG